MKTSILAEEVRVLAEYASGHYIDPDSRDARMIDRLSAIGLMKQGLDVETMRETASITVMGRRILKNL
jgi:hypothetical protein